MKKYIYDGNQENDSTITLWLETIKDIDTICTQIENAILNEN